MNVKNQKKLAARLLKVGKRRIVFDSAKLTEIKEAITKKDLRALIAGKSVKLKPLKSHSRSRTRKVIIQRRKGRRKSKGSKKGSKYAKITRKRQWMDRIRTQRKFIKSLKSKNLISKRNFRDVYYKVKSNRFRNIRLIKLYMDENKLIEKNDIQKKAK